MSRIFLMLALFATVLLISNIVIGFSIGDYNAAARRYVAAQQEVRTTREPDAKRAAEARRAEASEELEPVRRRYALHSLCGIAAALVTVLVNSVAVTYFVGTSKWCGEVVDTYQLDPALAQESQRLKRRTFPWSVISMLTMIFLVALGAASDPGANFQGSGDWVNVHMAAALLGTALVGWSFFVQVGNIGANYAVIEQIIALVKRRTEGEASGGEGGKSEGRGGASAGGEGSVANTPQPPATPA